MKRHLQKISTLFCWLLLVSGTALAQSNPVFTSIYKACVTDALQQPGEKRGVNDILGRMRSDGGFSDHTQSDEFILGSRILTLAQAYHDDPQWKGNASLKNNIYKALDYWFANESISTSIGGWTARGLRYPRNTGFVAILMKGALDADTRNNPVAQRIDKEIKNVFNEVFFDHHNRVGNVLGPNLSSRLRGGVYLATYAENEAWMAQIKRKATETFEVASGMQTQEPGHSHVGLTPDYSFHHHNTDGGQNIWTNYGIVWLDEIGKYIELVKGTKYDLERSEYGTLYKSITEGLQYFIYRTNKNYLLAGRYSLYPDMYSGAASITIKRIMNAVPSGVYTGTQMSKLHEIENQWRRRDLSPIFSKSKYFYTSDMMVHVRTDHYLSVKMLSNRTASLELGIGYSTKNYHQGDGGYLLWKDGTEYADARACWISTAVPGITAEQKTGAPDMARTGTTDSRNSFAGGLSDSRNTVGAFILDKDQSYSTINAQKGYFLFDDVFGFLGSNINQKAGSPKGDTWTTLDQREQRGEVIYHDGRREQTIRAGQSVKRTLSGVTQPVWFHHDGFGYVIVPRKAVDVMLWAENRTGLWRDVFGGIRSTSSESLPIFQVSINHGRKPAQAGYEYMIIPNVKASDMPALVRNLPLTNLRNDNNAMAMFHQEEGILQAVFYKKNETVKTPLGLEVTTDKPAVVMVKEETNGIKLNVSDPLQAEDKMTITLNGEYSGAGAVWDAANEVTIITVNLPKGYNKGQQVDLTLTRGGGAPANIQPVAKFTHSLDNSGLAPATLKVDATKSRDPDGSIVSYAWDFGDGNTATGSTAEYTYRTPGTFTVTLTLTDNGGLRSTATRSIVIGERNQAPVASFEYVLPGNVAPATMGVDAGESKDPDGSIVSYDWDFGDGNTGTGVTASCTYQAAGKYDVVLTVTDDKGMKHSTKEVITVIAEPTSAPAPSTPSSPSACALPTDWHSADIGNVGISGTACEDGGVYTLTASGNDLGPRMDQGHFAFTRIQGNADIRVRVTSVSGGDAEAVAGLMIRESLEDNAAHGTVVFSPQGRNTIAFPHRYREGYKGREMRHNISKIKTPYFMRIVRKGNSVNCYYSANGKSWTKYKGGSVKFTSNEVYVGLVVSAHTNGEVAVAEFDNLEINGKQTQGPASVNEVSNLSIISRPGSGGLSILWETASENNLSHFDVERSTDGSFFTSVDNVTAKGFSATQTSYEGVDANPYQGKAFYRVRITDGNGGVTYSNVVEFTLSSTPKASLSIYPNPAIRGQRIQIEAHIPDATALLIQIYDQQGKLVWKKYQRVSDSRVKREFPTSILPAGKYVISVTDNGQSKAYLHENLIVKPRN